MAQHTLSNLSDPRYGYDYVVATTQRSINATLKEFLSGITEPEVTVCYVADGLGRPSPVDYNELRGLATVDPFSIPNGSDPATNPDLQKLLGVRFMMAFRARIGIPKGTDPEAIPDIVILGGDIRRVTFNLICEEFDAVELSPGGYAAPHWFHQSQEPGKPVIFESEVNLSQQIVDTSNYPSLPTDIKNALHNLSGTAFSVQQLLFDLSRADLTGGVPKILTLTPGTPLYMVLQQYFVGAYFTQMQKEGQPLLGCSIVKQAADPATLELASFNMQIDVYVDPDRNPHGEPSHEEAGASTLNYLCTTQGKQQRVPNQFDWNWIDKSEVSQYDGVLSFNRQTFATWFDQVLKDFVPPNCVACKTSCWRDVETPRYDWWLTAGQIPDTSFPATGDVVLRYRYHSDGDDSASHNLGSLHIYSDYELTVSFRENTVVIWQHLVIYMYVRANLTSRDGKVIDKTIEDTYTLSVNGNGTLNWPTTPSTKSTDFSDPPSNIPTAIDNLIHVNNVIDACRNTIKAFNSTTLQTPPLASMAKFIFPGGKSFAFKSVNFSPNQDLVCHITYVDPVEKVETAKVNNLRSLRSAIS
ncbi:hypothetical protein G6514_001494 [Epicoccum nigrum]|nr:hypothetical protein G6514_001494 [Epicoccum nigrum]